ncbi:MAG TPA: hypothetical protein VKG85_11505 [Actinomycetes bacterium]|nr:hypothetical protein [Actinomycetes bacterium]
MSASPVVVAAALRAVLSADAAAITRVVSSAAAPTTAPAINAMPQVSGYPTRIVTTSPARAAYPAVSSRTTLPGGIPWWEAALAGLPVSDACLAAPSSRGPAIRTAAIPAAASIGRPSSTFSCTNHQPRSASTATVLTRASVTSTAAARRPSASLARRAAAVAPAADHAATLSSATTWSTMIN